MNRASGALAIAVLLAACSPAVPPDTSVPAGTQPGEEAAVLKAMDAYMTAIATNDVRNLAPLQTVEGTTFRARATAAGGMDIVPASNAYRIDPARNNGRTNRERYWSPTVLIRGSVQADPSLASILVRSSGSAADMSNGSPRLPADAAATIAHSLPTVSSSNPSSSSTRALARRSIRLRFSSAGSVSKKHRMSASTGARRLVRSARSSGERQKWSMTKCR